MTEPQIAKREVSSIINVPAKDEVIIEIGTGHKGSASVSLVQAENSGDNEATSKPSMTGLEMSPIISKQSLNSQEATTSEADSNIKKESNVKETTKSDTDVAEHINSKTNVEEAIQHSLQSKSENTNSIENVEPKAKDLIVITSVVDIKNKDTDFFQSPPEFKNTLPTTNINNQAIIDFNINDISKPATDLRDDQNDKESKINQVDPAPTSNVESAKLSDVNPNPIDTTSNDKSNSQNIVNTANNDDTTNTEVVDTNLLKEQQENEQANSIASVNENLPDEIATNPQEIIKTTKVEVVAKLNTDGKVLEDINRSDSGLLNKNVNPNEGENEVNVQVNGPLKVIDSKVNEIISNDEENKKPAVVVNNPNDLNINENKPELKGEGSKLSAQEVNKLDKSNVEDDKVPSSDNQNTEVATPADNRPVLNDKISKQIVDANNDTKPEDNGRKEKIIDDKNELEKKEITHTDELSNPSNNQPEVGSKPSIIAEEKDDKTNDATISEPKKNLNDDNKNDNVEKQSKDDKSALNASANVQESKSNETQNPKSSAKKEINPTDSVVEKKKEGFLTSILNYIKKTEEGGSKSSEFDPLKLCIVILIVIVLVALIGIGLINFLVKKSE